MKQFILANATLFAACFSAIGQSQQQVLFTNSSDNIRIVYTVQGEGMPALVFVHGWSCDRSYWKGQVEPFSRQYQVITIDLAGHGESGNGRKAWTIEAFGADVAAVVKKLNLPQVILVGHSMGGDVIAEAALQLPGKVAGLIMVDVYRSLGPGRAPGEVQAFKARIAANFRDSTRAVVRSMFLPDADSVLVEQVATDMSSAPPDIALAALEAALSYSREMPKTLQKLKLPVMAINAGNSPTDIASMEKHGVSVMIMPGVAHFLMMEDPAGFNPILHAAIEKLLTGH